MAFAALTRPIHPQQVRQVKPASRRPRVDPRLTSDPNYELAALAVKKGLIDEDDLETELLELSTYTPIELEDYRERVASAGDYDGVVDGVAPGPAAEPTEAERALAEFRAGTLNTGPMPKGSLPTSGLGESRNLADLAADRKAMLATGVPTTSEYEQFEREFFGDGGAASRVEARQKRAAETMKNLKGITRPVVAQGSQFSPSMSEIFASMDWTVGRRG